MCHQSIALVGQARNPVFRKREVRNYALLTWIVSMVPALLTGDWLYGAIAGLSGVVPHFPARAIDAMGHRQHGNAGLGVVFPTTDGQRPDKSDSAGHIR